VIKQQPYPGAGKKTALYFFIISAFLAGSLFMHGCADMTANIKDRYLPSDLPKTWNIELSEQQMPVTDGLLSIINDRDLTSLVREAVQNNYDLRATALRLKAQGYLLKSSGAKRFPEIGAEFSGERGNHLLDEETGQYFTGNDNRVTLSLGWEIDIWGKLADENRADEYMYYGQKEEFLKARDALAARVIQVWIERIIIKNNLILNQERVRLLKQIEDLIKDRFLNGTVTLDDLSAARARVDLAKAEVTGYRKSLRQSTRQLEVLLGRYPEGKLSLKKEIPIIPALSPQTPVAVLLNRHDVKNGIANIKAKAYTSCSARKARLPEIKFSGQVFRDSAVLGSLGSSPTYRDFLGSLFQPIFSGGRLINQAEAKNNEYQAALMDLQETVLLAMKEVEDLIDSEQQFASQRELLESALKQSENSVSYYQDRYRQGLATFHELQTALEQKIDIQMKFNETKGQNMLNRIELMLALGAGVWNPNGNHAEYGDMHAKR
jgi:NodT family efflux transporter outer membrane factor (OMF) lipoprotein